MPTRGYTRSSARRPAARPRRTRIRTSPAPSTSPDLADRRRAAGVRGRRTRARARRAAPARVDGGGARRLRRQPSARAARGRRRPRRDHGVPAPAPAGRRGPDERRRQLHRLGAPLRRVLAASAPSSPPQRLDGLRGRRRRSRRRSSTPTGSRVCLAGDGDFVMSSPGVRDRGAVRPAHPRAARQQRHVRDDSHAPGAARSPAA